MKKLFAILLCIAMMLSMVACGGNQDNNESQNTTQNNWVENDETTIAQPTAEEWAAIDQYRDIMQKLDAYAEDGYICVDYADFGIAGDSESIFGNDALALFHLLFLSASLGHTDTSFARLGYFIISYLFPVCHHAGGYGA